MENQITTTEPRIVKDYLALPSYKERFNEVMGRRAPQFMAAITACSQMPSLRDAEPRSVIAAAMVAATLDLAINPTLGQAHIVAYRDQSGTSVAQFQVGWKGLVQLALRSGQYKRLNAGPVNGEVFKGYDMVGEPKLDFALFNPLSPITGYFCAFETMNGFQKVVYWTKAQAEGHAKRFSKAYQKGFKSSPWFSDFDSMATKTVVKAALTKWGIMSVEMQRVAIHDQGAQVDVEAEVTYVDNEAPDTDAVPGEPITPRPTPAKRTPKGASAVAENPAPKASAPEIVVPAEEQSAPPAPIPEPAPPTPKAVELAADPLPDKPVVAPRAFIKEGEELVSTVKVTAILQVGEGTNPDGQKQPAIKASVTGDYNTEVVHFGGATVKDGVATPLPAWKVGGELRLTLVGRKNPRGVVQAIVTALEVVGQSEEF